MERRERLSKDAVNCTGDDITFGTPPPYVDTQDPYEKKLYSLFCSHDVECKGSLSVGALKQLCTTLELRETGTKLVQALVHDQDATSPAVRITFKAFKEELLNVLGTEISNSSPTGHESELTESPRTPSRRSRSSKEDVLSSTSQSQSVSPIREINPRLVVGAKKYGRRSRPQVASRVVLTESESEMDSNAEDDDRMGTKVYRSSSQTDVKRRRPPQTGTKLKRCASLPAQRNMAREYVSRGLSRNNESSMPLKSQLDSSLESLDGPSIFRSEDHQIVPSETIVEMWESIGILNANALLKDDLGFDGDQINIQQLSGAIDEELNGLRTDCPDDERISMKLLRASLVLHKTEVNGLQVALKQLSDENQRLYTSNRDSNDRVALLAQEVDERHANIENSTRLEMRTLEQRHAESVRELTRQLEHDREQWATLIDQSKARIKQLETEEARVRIESERMEERNAALEAEQQAQQQQLAECLETNIRLNNEICELEDRYKCQEYNRGDRENEEIMELIEKITTLQTENADLRDRNDELSADIDVITGELTVLKARRSKLVQSVELNSESDGEAVSLGTSPGGNSSGNGLATKRRGDSPSKSKMVEESPRLGKVRKRSTDDQEWGSPLNAELEEHQKDVAGSANNVTVVELRERVKELEERIKQCDINSLTEGGPVQGEQTEKKKCLNCHETETTLEMMQKEFDSLEDYWQTKLNEERQLFEEEQRVNDDKFNELLQKMLEYEDQFAETMKKEDDKRLSTIDERDILEQQYMELEMELNELKVEHKRLIKEKNVEIKEIKEDLKRMRVTSAINSDPFNVSLDRTSTPESPASSPINYLWNQSTIQAPARDYHNPNWTKPATSAVTGANNLYNLSATTTTTWASSNNVAINADEVDEPPIVISPIQKPKPGSITLLNNCDQESVASSADRHSTTSTYNVIKPAAVTAADEAVEVKVEPETDLLDQTDSNVEVMREEMKRMQALEAQLQEDCKELTFKRDALLNELQKLNEMRPVLEKTYAKTIHPNLTTRIQQLEQKNRHLQSLMKQQQHYSETLMHQTWQQQRAENTELRNQLEGQSMTLAEQAQRLSNADVLVKELFVENSHLRANIQRLEQQTMRSNYSMFQHPGTNGPGINGVPSFP